VGSDVFLQAGDGHGHLIRQAPLLEARELPTAKQISHAAASLLELTFEPSMLRAADSIGREGAHEAPVENTEEEGSRQANKKQIVFSLYVRLWRWLWSRRQEKSSKSESQSRLDRVESAYKIGALASKPSRQIF
jgi:hypothetical protein